MADTTRPITYRGVNLNDAATDADTKRIVGNMVEEVRWFGVSGVSYTEKRAQEDGNDSADVYDGPRRVQVSGVTYGSTRGDMYDRAQALRAAFTPTLAYDDAPEQRGYQPFAFEEPTENLADFEDGFKSLFVMVRPVAQPDALINRDRTGSTDLKGGGLPWTVVLEAEDPIRYVSPETVIEFSGTGDGEDVGFAMANRGDYPSPIEITLLIPPAADPEDPETGDFRFLGFGADIHLEFTTGEDELNILYEARDRLVYLVDEDGVKTLALEMLTVDTEVMAPKVLPGGGTANWSMDGLSTAWSGTLHWFESFA